jgi:ABC-2 type transport system ATP-binding protein
MWLRILRWRGVRSVWCHSTTRSTGPARSPKISAFTVFTSGFRALPQRRARRSERAGAYPSQLSGGLAQRVQIARAIAHRPKVLFLDEPSAGLDPQSRIAMWEAVRSLKDQGLTVVLTTHYMEEADELCDRVAIIDHGRILVEDTPSALKSSVGAQRMYLLRLRRQNGKADLQTTLEQIDGVTKVESTSEGVRVLAHGSDGVLPEVLAAAGAFGLADLSITETSLETVFIELTGRDLRE